MRLDTRGAAESVRVHALRSPLRRLVIHSLPTGARNPQTQNAARPDAAAADAGAATTDGVVEAWSKEGACYIVVTTASSSDRNGGGGGGGDRGCRRLAVRFRAFTVEEEPGGARLVLKVPECARVALPPGVAADAEVPLGGGGGGGGSGFVDDAGGAASAAVAAAAPAPAEVAAPAVLASRSSISAGSSSSNSSALVSASASRRASLDHIAGLGLVGARFSDTNEGFETAVGSAALSRVGSAAAAAAAVVAMAEPYGNSSGGAGPAAAVALAGLPTVLRLSADGELTAAAAAVAAETAVAPAAQQARFEEIARMISGAQGAEEEEPAPPPPPPPPLGDEGAPDVGLARPLAASRRASRAAIDQVRGPPAEKHTNGALAGPCCCVRIRARRAPRQEGGGRGKRC